MESVGLGEGVRWACGGAMRVSMGVGLCAPAQSPPKRRPPGKAVVGWFGWRIQRLATQVATRQASRHLVATPQNYGPLSRTYLSIDLRNLARWLVTFGRRRENAIRIDLLSAQEASG